MAGTDYARFMPDVAAILLGPPNQRLSSKTELRYGTNGSLSVDVEGGTFYDHQAKEGGGVTKLIARQTGCNANGEATAWLREHGFALDDEASPPQARARIVATYDYLDETGDLVFQVVRFEPKTFRQRRKPQAGDDPAKIRDGWVWSVKGIRQVPYRLPEIQEAIALERTVFIVEGEKDADNLWKLGFPATCNAMGAGKWPESLSRFFADADVVLLPDNDDPGREHIALVGSGLAKTARRVRVLELPDLPAKGDASDWIKAAGTPEALNALVDTTAYPFGSAPPKVAFQAVWFKDIHLALKDPEWLIDDVLTRSDLSLIYGESQSGKSFLATDFAMGIARGVDVLGHKVRRPGGVIYVAAEGKQGFKWRLTAYRQHYQLGEADLPFLLVPVAVDMFAEEGAYPAFLADLAIHKNRLQSMGIPLDMVVFDTHAAVSPGANENASEDVSRLMRHYSKVQEVTDRAHVMIVHHKNAGGEKPRGHTSLYAGVDNAIEVTKDGTSGLRTARIAKLKDAPDGQSIGFRLQSVEIGARDDGKPITSCVVVPAQAHQRTGKGPRLSDQQNIALQALREALISRGEPAPSALQLPLGITVCRGEFWKREFLQRGFIEEPNENTFRSAFKRVGEALKARGIIGTNSPYVWIAREPSA